MASSAAKPAEEIINRLPKSKVQLGDKTQTVPTRVKHS